MNQDRVVVVGGGTMGRGIAYVAAMSGYSVALNDVTLELAEEARGKISALMQRGVERGRIRRDEMEAALGRLAASGDLRASAAEAGLVIESVPERVELKQEIFRAIDETAPQDAVLATNTSSLSITELAAVTRHPERVVGMHFFNPVHLMKLVEIVRGLETAPESLESVRQAALRMGKEVVTVNEFPGFVTSRINAMIGNEAFYMLQEGVASAEDIDQALRLGLNHPMGPFEMIDLVGLDVRLGVLSYLHQSLGEKYRPAPLLVQHVRAGRLGRKVGRGVYAYDADGNRIPAKKS